MPSMKILVTGAAGFIGSHVAEALADEHEVMGVDNFSDYYPVVLKKYNVEQLQKKGVAVKKLDLAADDLSAFKDVEVVYHFAAQPGISAKTPFDAYLKNNVIATYRLLKALPSAYFVNISTSSVYGKNATGAENTEPKPASYYGVTKLAAEQLVMTYQRDRGYKACSLRIFSVYGPRERPEKLYSKLIKYMFEDKPFPLYKGSSEHVRSYTYVKDIVKGCLHVLVRLGACNGEIINLGNNKAITTGEGIAIVEELMGKKASFEEIDKRPGDQLKTQANIEKAKKILGYEPTTSPQEGLKETIEWYKHDILGKIDY